MHHGYRELLTPSMIRFTLATNAAVVVVMALVGPAGTFYSHSFLERLAFGALYSCVSWPTFYAQIVVTLYLFRSRKTWQIWIAVGAATMLAAWPISAMVFAIESVAHPTYAAEIGLLHIYVLVAASAAAWSALSFYLVWHRVRHGTAATETRDASHDLSGAWRNASETTTASNGGGEAGPSPPDSEDTSPADEAEAESAAAPDESMASLPPEGGAAPSGEEAPLGTLQLVPERPARLQGALVKLLPERLGTDLIYIKSEDHYLEVHTTVGSSLIKMRFSDAVAELSDRGIKVHRSYWVATRHVTRSVRNGKRTLLRLTGGHKVPVSVTHLPAVRAVLRR